MNSPFVPTFEPQAYVISGPFRSILNMNYFATLDTAMVMAEKFGADHVGETPYPSGGPISAEGADGGPLPPQRLLVWRDGLEMNAGILAAFYIRNPEAEFPGLAEKMIWQAISSQRALMATMQGTGDGQ